jgi:hypothetical protein
MARTKGDERLRNLRAAAREYRTRGYDVIEEPGSEQLPPFLQGFTPDLIATRDDDRVVLEIKRREELKGSNAFVALATAVNQQVGWRLELLHLASRRPAMVGSDKANLDRLVARSLAAREAGMQDAALIYALSVLEELIRDIGAQHRIKVWQLSTRAIVHDLAFLGVLGEEAADVHDRAWEQRERIMRGASAEAYPDAAAIAELIDACQEIQEAMQLEPA